MRDIIMLILFLYPFMIYAYEYDVESIEVDIDVTADLFMEVHEIWSVDHIDPIKGLCRWIKEQPDELYDYHYITITNAQSDTHNIIYTDSYTYFGCGMLNPEGEINGKVVYDFSYDVVEAIRNVYTSSFGQYVFTDYYFLNWELFRPFSTQVGEYSITMRFPFDVELEENIFYTLYVVDDDGWYIGALNTSISNDEKLLHNRCPEKVVVTEDNDFPVYYYEGKSYVYPEMSVASNVIVFSSDNAFPADNGLSIRMYFYDVADWSPVDPTYNWRGYSKRY